MIDHTKTATQIQKEKALKEMRGNVLYNKGYKDGWRDCAKKLVEEMKKL